MLTKRQKKHTHPPTQLFLKDLRSTYPKEERWKHTSVSVHNSIHLIQGHSLSSLGTMTLVSVEVPVC